MKISMRKSYFTDHLAVILLIGSFWNATTSQILSENAKDVRFYLYSDWRNPSLRQEIVYNDASTLHSSSFRLDKKTVLIIHGFNANHTSPMSHTVKNAYLSSNLGYNYILVDWGALAQPKPYEDDITQVFYTFAADNVPITGNRVADFIHFLIKSSSSSIGNDTLSVSDFHLVGHSLGAHVSGIAGFYMKTKYGINISRITGLDPAGHVFYPPVQYRNLEKADASFVDVIHTNAGFFGDVSRHGHVDFYPNGGFSQPNCTTAAHANEVLAVEDNTDKCSHSYVYKVYAASFTQAFLACPCSPFEAVEMLGQFCWTGNCSEAEQVRMGYDCPKTARGTYFIQTQNPKEII